MKRKVEREMVERATFNRWSDVAASRFKGVRRTRGNLVSGGGSRTIKLVGFRELFVSAAIRGTSAQFRSFTDHLLDIVWEVGRKGKLVGIWFRYSAVFQGNTTYGGGGSGGRGVGTLTAYRAKGF